MGLDGVELILNVEETFAISISDDEAERIVTAGDLYQCVLSKFGDGRSTECLSQGVFYAIRKVLDQQFNISRAEITLTKKLDEIFPVQKRISDWQRFAEGLNYVLPPLYRPRWLVVALGILAVDLYASGLLLARFVGSPGISSLLVVSGLLIVPASIMLTKSYKYTFPVKCITIKDLVQVVLILNYGAIAKAKAKWNEDEVWKVLQGIIVEQLSVRPEQVTKDARFVKDLGAN